MHYLEILWSVWQGTIISCQRMSNLKTNKKSLVSYNENNVNHSILTYNSTRGYLWTLYKNRSILSQKSVTGKKAQTRAEQNKMDLKSHCKTQAKHTTFRDRRIRSRICRINRHCATQDLWKTNSTQDQRNVLKIPGVIETFGEPTASLVIMATLRLARSLFSLLRAGVPIEASRPCVVIQHDAKVLRLPGRLNLMMLLAVTLALTSSPCSSQACSSWMGLRC